MKHFFSHILPGLSLLILLFSTAIRSSAQDFSVRQFRMIPNDISAYIDPVRDLNDEACALLKVVGDKDFAFSSPLGIVKRKNDVGEIWIYLPKGSIMITIKHPQWGVMRDYRFTTPLESRMTYELVLDQPVGYRHPIEMPPLQQPCLPDTTLSLAGYLPLSPTPRPRRPREPWKRLMLLSAGLHADGPAIGLRLALMRRHGAYLYIQKDFHRLPQTVGECDKNGFPNGSDEAPYYTSHTQNYRWALAAGGIHRLAGNLCLYEGLGYAQREVAWQQYDGTYLRNKDYSYKGLSMEAGFLYRLRHIAFSAGVISIQARYWETVLGIGINF